LRQQCAGERRAADRDRRSFAGRRPPRDGEQQAHQRLRHLTMLLARPGRIAATMAKDRAATSLESDRGKRPQHRRGTGEGSHVDRRDILQQGRQPGVGPDVGPPRWPSLTASSDCATWSVERPAQADPLGLPVVPEVKVTLSVAPQRRTQARFKAAMKTAGWAEQRADIARGNPRDGRRAARLDRFTRLSSPAVLSTWAICGALKNSGTGTSTARLARGEIDQRPADAVVEQQAACACRERGTGPPRPPITRAASTP